MQYEGNYSLDYVSSGSVKEPVLRSFTKKKTGSMFLDKVDWFTKFKCQNYDENYINSELQIGNAKMRRLDQSIKIPKNLCYQIEPFICCCQIRFYSMETGHAHYYFHTLNKTNCLLLQGNSTGSGQLICHMTNIMFYSA